MKRLLITALSTVTLSMATIVAGSAFAQDAQLTEEVTAKLMSLGIELPASVTSDQVMQIESVLNGTDGDAEKKMAIDTIVAE